MIEYIEDQMFIKSEWDLEQAMCKYDCKTPEELDDFLWKTYGVVLVIEYKK